MQPDISRSVFSKPVMKAVSFIRRVMRSLLLSRIRTLFLGKIQIHRPYERFGSEYGGWNIVTDAMGRDSIVYSCGVGTDVSFDLGLIERYSVAIHAFDPTPRSKEWVSSQSLPEGFRFHPIGIAGFDGTETFFEPPDPTHVSYSTLRQTKEDVPHVVLPVKRLQTIMRDIGHDHIDILKMDIEGTEYAVIKDMLDCGITPSQVFVEFHHRFEPLGVLRTCAALIRLRRHGYGIFFISPDYQEYSFILTGQNSA